MQLLTVLIGEDGTPVPGPRQGTYRSFVVAIFISERLCSLMMRQF
jgi:hypothetical protein